MCPFFSVHSSIYKSAECTLFSLFLVRPQYDEQYFFLEHISNQIFGQVMRISFDFGRPNFLSVSFRVRNFIVSFVFG